MKDDRLAAALAYQIAILDDVSRTFALTIPQLPERLRVVVGNAYLLCRIADTIEDADSLAIEEKQRFSRLFADVVAGTASPEVFGAELAPRLAGSTLPAERDLVAHTPDVIAITHSFPEADRAALLRCVRVMTEGMEKFQEGQFRHGLRDVPDLGEYCYYVAGVVGQMLTQLFCNYSSEIAAHGITLRALAVSFGQGLQMTNILKDIWDDKARDACWLPQDVFARHGFDLATLSLENHGPTFQAGLLDLVSFAHVHLEHALEYTLTIPKSEKGIRMFCLWALGMAVLTLQKIRRNPGFTSGSEVKISRRSVHGVILVTRVLARSNRLLRWAFRLASAGLSAPQNA